MDTQEPIAANWLEGLHNTLLGLIAMLRMESTDGAACRELSLAITRLEEAEHWLAKVPPPAPQDSNAVPV
jgi:hypothetical protein